jgi:cohesin complex subunit SCC1
MFYSEQLLSKTGPLARVWLASNVERKLSKSQILQSDIQSSVGAIVDQGQAPMALRLSGQLMLGVVRIYGRKARYLLDDCNETLLKIRMTFKKTTNNDLPNQQGVTLDLNLPDVLTVDDLFPSLDLSFPMTQTLNIEIDKSQSFNDDWTSSLAPRISTQTRMSPDEAPLLEDDPGLELDLGDDIGFGNNTSMTIEAEVGRNAPAARPDNPSMLFDDNDKPFLDDELPLDIGDDVQMTDAPLNTEYDNPENFFGEDDDGMAPPGDDTFQLANDDARPPRDTDSPLSDAPVDIDGEFADQTAMEETEIAAQQHQRVRKRKLLLPDRETVLHNSQIKAQAEDRSKILRPVQQLPRDPYLLTLMQLQKTGEFVTNIMQDSRSKNWAPELQGLLSFDVVRSMAGAKRKRDSGIADVDSDGEGSAKSPRLELPDDEEEEDFAALNDEGVQMGQRDETVFEIPGENALAPEENAMNVMDQEDEDGIFMDNEGGFDETTMPLLHPADAGPVSLGTKHAVHLLREKLGGGPNSSTPQGKRSVLLQELVPEGKTSREEATKMFFEVLVLATKDAVKVEQPGGDTKLGAPLRVRGKRGLWGAWAEMNEALDEAQGEVEMAASG